jgi:hypothetical protein
MGLQKQREEKNDGSIHMLPFVFRWPHLLD